MTSCSISCLLLLKMFITLLPVFEAAQIQVSPEVTGYVNHAVTLPCQFIKTHKEVKVTLVEWRLKQQEEEGSTSIIFFSKEKIVIRDTFLKDRVNMSERSLIIKDVQMKDAGLYTCVIATFPYGSLEGTTRLVVQEPILKALEGQMLLIKLIVFGVFVLITVTMATTTYCTIIKIRRKAADGFHVSTDSSNE